MTLGSVLAAYGIKCDRPYRVGAGRNNEHWYVGADLVLRRYGPLRSDAAIAYEQAIVASLRAQDWPVAVARRSASGGTVVVEDERRYALFPRLAGRRGEAGRPRHPRELGRMLAVLHRDLAKLSVPAPAEAFPRVLEVPGDPAWLRLDDLDDPGLATWIRGKLADVTAAAASVPKSQLQVVHGDWHDGNVLYQGGSMSGILDFDFVHPDVALVDVAIATMIPPVAASAELVLGYFGSQRPKDHELDLITVAQLARALGHVAHFVSRHFDGDLVALEQVHLGVERLRLAEQRWPPLRAAILSGAPG